MIKLEEKFIELIGANESNCKDLETWIESFIFSGTFA